MIELNDNSKILFIGDSITSCGRNLYMELGFGFPNMVTAMLSAKYPNKNISAVSRGIGRNRTCDMLKRWKTDCLDVDADIVVILIGVNDALEQFFTGVMAEDYNQIIKNLTEMVSSLKDKTVILLEPFMNINSGKFTNPWGIDENWINELTPIRNIVKEAYEERLTVTDEKADIVLAELGNDAGIYGAMELIKQEL